MRLRHWIKAIGKRKITRQILSRIMCGYVRLTMFTGHWTWDNIEILDQLEQDNKPIILAFWHGRLLLMSATWMGRKSPFRMLISTHRDGDIPAWAIEYMGLGTIRGSSRRGGVSALRTLIRTLKSGCSVGFTPDGPRGPRMRVKGGIITAAQMSGATIVPVSLAAKSMHVMNSWDQLVIPMPFSRGIFKFGTPITVPRKMDSAAFDEKRLELEGVLNDLSVTVDKLMGHYPVEPDKVSAAMKGAEP